MNFRDNFTFKMLTVTLLYTTCDLKIICCACIDGLGVEGPEWLAEERERRLEQVDSGTESADDRFANTETHYCVLNHTVCFFFLNGFFCIVCPDRENGPCHSRGDSAAGDRFERGALSLPESPDRTPSPRGEIRRPEGGDGFIGEEHIHTSSQYLLRHCLSDIQLARILKRLR